MTRKFFYWSFESTGWLVIKDNHVYSMPWWGSRRRLFELWREYDLRLTLREMYRLDLVNGDAP